MYSSQLVLKLRPYGRTLAMAVANIDAVMRLTEISKNAIDHLEETAYLLFKMQP